MGANLLDLRKRRCLSRGYQRWKAKSQNYCIFFFSEYFQTKNNIGHKKVENTKRGLQHMKGGIRTTSRTNCDSILSFQEEMQTFLRWYKQYFTFLVFELSSARIYMPHTFVRKNSGSLLLLLLSVTCELQVTDFPFYKKNMKISPPLAFKKLEHKLTIFWFKTLPLMSLFVLFCASWVPFLPCWQRELLKTEPRNCMFVLFRST